MLAKFIATANFENILINNMLELRLDLYRFSFRSVRFIFYA